MKTFKSLVTLGFVIAGLGWCLGAFLGLREIAIPVFVAGFLIAAAGIVGGTLVIPAGIGMKIAAIGFGVGCLSAVPAFFLHNEEVANYVFYIGLIIVILGVSIFIFDNKLY